MFERLQQHRREQWRRREQLLLRSWNELALRKPGDGRLFAFFGSSNLFWPYSMDRQLAAIMAGLGARDTVLNLGSFGFGDSTHVVSTLLAMREAYRRRPVDLVIYEVTPNEMPPLDKDDARAFLRRSDKSRLVLDYDDAAPIVARLRQVDLPLRENLVRLAGLAKGHNRPYPVLVLDYESNLREWPPTISYFSRALDTADRHQFERSLVSAIAAVRSGNWQAAARELRLCRAIDGDVAIAVYLGAKVAEATGNVAQSEVWYRRARDLDLLRGRLSRGQLMPELQQWCAQLGFWFVSVPAIIRDVTAGKLPGFETFVDDVHYRPHVHVAIARAIAQRLQTEGFMSSAADATGRDGVAPAVDGQQMFVRLQCALNLVMVPPSPYNDERIAEGLRNLAVAAELGAEQSLLDEYRSRFRLLANGPDAVRSEHNEARTTSTPAGAGPGGLALETISATIADCLLRRYGLEVTAAIAATDLLCLGVDSLGLSELVMTLEEQFDVKLESLLFDRQVTADSLRDAIAKRLTEPPARRLAYERSVARKQALKQRRARSTRDLRMTPVTATDSQSSVPSWSGRSIAGILSEHCRELPDQPAVSLIPSGSRATTGSVDWTWRDLERTSGQSASWLQQMGIGSGDVVYLLTGHAPFLVSTIVGALRSGVVPAIGHAPSRKLSPEVFAETFAEVVRRSGPKAIIVDPHLDDLVRRCLSESFSPAHMPMIVSSASFGPGAESDYLQEYGGAAAETDRLALLQHSSGTTGARKAVMLTEAAVLRQVSHYARAIDLRRDERIVSWLPLYHDMGLVACFLLPLLTATPLTLMSALDWVAAPRMVLDAVTRDRGTLLWLPNFAFHFLAERLAEDELQGVDLSSLRAVINCSEPIGLPSWQRFYERFSAHGLSRTAYATCYAMAENVFAVTQGGITEPVYVDVVSLPALRQDGRAIPCDPADDSGVALLAVPSSGTPIDGSRVRVVSMDGARMPVEDRVVGEIEVQSDCLATGYCRNDEATAVAFDDGWYRTNDLGYVFADQLFVLGRKTDVIIVAGVNVFADDIEQTVAGIHGVKAGRVAAFGVRDERLGTERVVVMAETSDPRVDDQTKQTLRQAIQQRLQEALQLGVSDVHIMPAGTIRKTSSGKVARLRMRELFLARAASSLAADGIADHGESVARPGAADGTSQARATAATT